jgi:hypothetical protein
MDDDILQDEDQIETLFWYDILYAVGSQVVNIARSLRSKSDNQIELGDVYDDTITRVFIGYWTLSTISDL